jgi:hypothetical protein
VEVFLSKFFASIFGKIQIGAYLSLTIVALKAGERSALFFSLAAYRVSFRSGQVFSKTIVGDYPAMVVLKC